MSRAPRAAVVVAVAALLGAGRAEATRVVVVRPPADSTLGEGLAVRLGAELRALGFEVVEVALEGGGRAREAVEQVARREGAVGAVYCDPAGAAAVDVWVTETLTGKTVVRRVRAGGGGGGGGEDATRVLVLRSIELLRASLLELDDPIPRDAAARAIAAPVQRLLARGRAAPRGVDEAAAGAPAWSLRVGVAWVPVRGASPAFAPEARLAYRWPGGATAAISWTGPTAGGVAAGDAGRALLTTMAATAGAGYRGAWRAVPLEPYALVAVGVLVQRSEGAAVAPYESRTVLGAAALGELTAGVAVRLGARLRLEAEGAAGLALPAVSVRVLDGEVAVVGLPWLRAALAAAVEF